MLVAEDAGTAISTRESATGHTIPLWIMLGSQTEVSTAVTTRTIETVGNRGVVLGCLRSPLAKEWCGEESVKIVDVEGMAVPLDWVFGLVLECCIELWHQASRAAVATDRVVNDGDWAGVEPVETDGTVERERHLCLGRWVGWRWIGRCNAESVVSVCAEGEGRTG